MRLGLVLAMAAVFLGVPSLAHALAGPADPRPHYIRTGKGFGCTHERADFERMQLRPDLPPGFVCMRMGMFEIGMQRADLEKTIGQHDDQTVDGGRTYYIYGLQGDNSGTVVTYLVARYDAKNEIDMLQLTGAPWPGAWRFSGIGLGDSEAALQERLGAPLQVMPGAGANTVQWSYLPWEFSFELSGGRVSSIHIEP